MINNYFTDEEYHQSNLIYNHPIYRHSLHLGDMSSALDTEFLLKSQIRTGNHLAMPVITSASGMEHVKYEPQL